MACIIMKKCKQLAHILRGDLSTCKNGLKMGPFRLRIQMSPLKSSLLCVHGALF